MRDRKVFGMRLAILIAIGILLAYTTLPRPVLKLDEDGFGRIIVSWENNIASANESNPGSTQSCILEVYIVNYSATSATYNDNASATYRTWANASLDPDGSGTAYYSYAHAIGGFTGTGSLSTTLTIKWGTQFTFLVRYRGNATCCKNATMFKDGSCRVKVNATGGGVTMSEVTLTNVVSYNNTGANFIWINAYSGPYTLTKGGTCTITNIKLEFNY